jgi:hypothetical protein
MLKSAKFVTNQLMCECMNILKLMLKFSCLIENLTALCVSNPADILAMVLASLMFISY